MSKATELKNSKVKFNDDKIDNDWKSRNYFRVQLKAISDKNDPIIPVFQEACIQLGIAGMGWQAIGIFLYKLKEEHNKEINKSSCNQKKICELNKLIDDYKEKSLYDALDNWKSPEGDILLEKTYTERNNKESSYLKYLNQEIAYINKDRGYEGCKKALNAYNEINQRNNSILITRLFKCSQIYVGEVQSKAYVPSNHCINKIEEIAKRKKKKIKNKIDDVGEDTVRDFIENSYGDRNVKGENLVDEFCRCVYHSFSFIVDVKWHKLGLVSKMPGAIRGVYNVGNQGAIDRLKFTESANDEDKKIGSIDYSVNNAVIYLKWKRKEANQKKDVLDELRITIDKNNFANALSYDDLEDLVFEYMKNENPGYNLYPSACKLSEPKFEFALYDKKGEKPITCQVKNQSTRLHIEDYIENIKNSDFEKIYLFSGAGVFFNDNGEEKELMSCKDLPKEYEDKKELKNKLIILKRDDLYKILYDNEKVDNEKVTDYAKNRNLTDYYKFQ